MMELTVWTPTGQSLRSKVKKVVAIGTHGSFCILPRHVDTVVGLRPGVLIYEQTGGESYLAVHEGCLTKKGSAVTVVTMQAYRGDDLEHLASQVQDMLHIADEGERRTRSALAGLESKIARGLAGLEVDHVSR